MQVRYVHSTDNTRRIRTDKRMEVHYYTVAQRMRPYTCALIGRSTSCPSRSFICTWAHISAVLLCLFTGDACRFSHGGAAPGAASSGSSFRPRRSRPVASKSQLCFSFSESQTCQYGDNCRFAHGENDERDLNQLKRRAAGVCYNWKESGECKFGT